MISIVGSTGAGKTALALKLSKYLPINVISADSRQVYKYMDIGTAKPTKEQRNQLTHYLVDYINPDEKYNLNKFIIDSNHYIDKINKGKNIPIIVGGTGLYIWALLDNWSLPDVPPNEKFRANLENKIVNFGHEYIKNTFINKLGTDFSGNYDLNNTRRLIRYLEIINEIGIEKFLKSSKSKNETNIIYGMDYSKEEQLTIIPERIEKMFKLGWIEEVENLIKNGYNLDHYSMSGIGYKEIYSYLNNKINYECMRELILNRTNSFIKKQRTWFKKSDNRITWINTIEDNKIIKNISEKILNSYDNKVNANN